MLEKHQFYINGAWSDPAALNPYPVLDPSTETAFATISLGGAEDVAGAVSAARESFANWGRSSKSERLAVLERLFESYRKREQEMATTISREMGAPIDLALRSQAGAGRRHLEAFIVALEGMEFERPLRPDLPAHQIRLEPIGVAALITPWNWPMNQIMLKVGAALAAGCTMVLKPSEIAPLSAMLFADMIDEARVPPGVFNLVNGDGAGVGTALTSHPDVDMVSFTGSTRAGVAISKSAADSLKRVSLELGGKSPNLVFADCDLEAAVRQSVSQCFNNTGQSCNAPTRMLVERSVYAQAAAIAADAAANTRVDLPSRAGGHIGPLVSEAQFDKVQRLIEAGVTEGARVVAGGPGRPEGLGRGWFVKPTIMVDVSPEMTVYREEIFGPVLCVTAFADEDEAVALANDTPYGLAAYMHTGDAARAHRVSNGLRAGMVQINGAARVGGTPFGGYKQSGNGREGGIWGIEEFLEVKSVTGSFWSASSG